MTMKTAEQIQFAIQHGFRPDARPGIHRYEAVLYAPGESPETTPPLRAYRVELFFDSPYAGTAHEPRERRPLRGARLWYVRETSDRLPVGGRQRWFSKAEGGAKGAWKHAIAVVRDLVAAGYTLKDPAPVEGAEMEAR